MNQNNELNDIILNKGTSASSNKKIILAVATLGVILIIVVMLMNSLTSSGTDNLPQTPIPPTPKAKATQTMKDEPLFEDVEVIEERIEKAQIAENNLDELAKKLKLESRELTPVPTTPKATVKPVTQVKTTPKPVAKVSPKPLTKTVKKASTSSSTNVKYYIQVGSFSKYAPNKKFLSSITSLGYTHTFHEVSKAGKTINKVLVGPFSTADKAKDARRVLRAKVEPGAFLIKL